MNGYLKYSISFLFRIMLYALLMFLLNEVFMFDAMNPTSTGKFGEICLTELLQEMFLLASGIIFLIIGRRDRELKAAANLASVFFFMCMIREVNNLVHFWMYLILPLAFLFIWLVYRDRKKLVRSVYLFLQMREIIWIVAGFLVTFVFSEFFHREIFWRRLAGSSFNWWVTDAAEEGTELLGYSLILIGGIEIILNMLKSRTKKEK